MALLRLTRSRPNSPRRTADPEREVRPGLARMRCVREVGPRGGAQARGVACAGRTAVTDGLAVNEDAGGNRVPPARPKALGSVGQQGGHARRRVASSSPLLPSGGANTPPLAAVSMADANVRRYIDTRGRV
jgi:hypothetical protein